MSEKQKVPKILRGIAAILFAFLAIISFIGFRILIEAKFNHVVVIYVAIAGMFCLLVAIREILGAL